MNETTFKYIQKWESNPEKLRQHELIRLQKIQNIQDTIVPGVSDSGKIETNVQDMIKLETK